MVNKGLERNVVTPPRRATAWTRWVRQPQSVWLRKALFQVHLWTGIGVGLYILMASLTGSALVFRRGLNALLRPATTVLQSGTPMTEDQLRAAAQQAYPRFQIARISMPARRDRAAEVFLAGGVRQTRLFDPYTGKDLGDADREVSFVLWLIELHDNLLGGPTGRFVNGLGGFLLALLCMTGAVIWWPGIASWHRGLTVRRGVNWKRFDFDLHSAVGFWTVVALFMWAVTGAYLGYPEPFQRFVELVDPFDPESVAPGTGDVVLEWFARLHFGRTFGTPLSVLWVIVGLAPAVLFVTGAIMWWNRVIRNRF
jgi:uncharacterized iron-regulated membrane protein